MHLIHQRMRDRIPIVITITCVVFVIIHSTFHQSALLISGAKTLTAKDGRYVGPKEITDVETVALPPPATPIATSATKNTVNNQKQQQEEEEGSSYVAAPVEQWIMNHMYMLGYDQNTTNPDACNIFQNKTFEIYSDLHQYIEDLTNYHTQVENFKGIGEHTDLRNVPKNECKVVRLDPAVGLEEMFHNQLSKTDQGYVEPLLTPMRHPMFCFNRKRLMDMKYMVHDFEAICQQIKPSSRTILIDMGASLDFHQGDVPIFYLLNLYKKFGIHFDHIYGFEMRNKDPVSVYQAVPNHLMASYHWINVGVSPEHGNKLNPLDSILRRFNKDDFIVIKVDVDTPSVELPLAHQLLNDESLHRMVDQFYFEHHVHAHPISGWWGKSMSGSIQDSFELFTAMRKKGVPAHFWP